MRNDLDNLHMLCLAVLGFLLKSTLQFYSKEEADAVMPDAGCSLLLARLRNVCVHPVWQLHETEEVLNVAHVWHTQC